MPDVTLHRNRTPVIVDDIISTGRTLVETVRHLKQAFLLPPACIGVHAVFADGAYEGLKAAGAGQIITCDTIPHETNRINLTELLVQAIQEVGGVRS